MYRSCPVSEMDCSAFEACKHLDCEYLTDDLVAGFHGCPSGYGSLQQIGRDIYDWRRATDSDLPPRDSYGGWLRMLYQMTLRCPSGRFRAQARTDGRVP